MGFGSWVLAIAMSVDMVDRGFHFACKEFRVNTCIAGRLRKLDEAGGGSS